MSNHLEDQFGKPKKELSSFFGGDAGAFKTTEEIFLAPDEVELRLVACEEFFRVAVTDLALLLEMGDGHIFNKSSDDSAIQEWNEQNRDAKVSTDTLNEKDFLANGFIGKERATKSNSRDEVLDANIYEGSRGFERSTEKEKATWQPQKVADEEPSMLPWILAGVLLLGILALLLRAFKSKSAS